jgi:hypothetical protein
LWISFLARHNVPDFEGGPGFVGAQASRYGVIVRGSPMVA